MFILWKEKIGGQRNSGTYLRLQGHQDIYHIVALIFSLMFYCENLQTYSKVEMILQSALISPPPRFYR